MNTNTEKKLPNDSKQHNGQHVSRNFSKLPYLQYIAVKFLAEMCAVFNHIQRKLYTKQSLGKNYKNDPVPNKKHVLKREV